MKTKIISKTYAVLDSSEKDLSQDIRPDAITYKLAIDAPDLRLARRGEFSLGIIDFIPRSLQVTYSWCRTSGHGYWAVSTWWVTGNCPCDQEICRTSHTIMDFRVKESEHGVPEWINSILNEYAPSQEWPNERTGLDTPPGAPSGTPGT